MAQVELSPAQTQNTRIASSGPPIPFTKPRRTIASTPTGTSAKLSTTLTLPAPATGKTSSGTDATNNASTFSAMREPMEVAVSPGKRQPTSAAFFLAVAVAVVPYVPYR